MKALDFPLLADENVHPDVVVFLRKLGLDVDSIAEQGQFGLPDIQVLQQATEANRAVLTHDSDFGGMAVFGAKFTGIIYLRPGHIRADFTKNTRSHSRQCSRSDAALHPRRRADRRHGKDQSSPVVVSLTTQTGRI